jgi:hypothetical protein
MIQTRLVFLACLLSCALPEAAAAQAVGPAAPTNVTATAVSSSAINLTWTKSATAGVITYTVYRSQTEGFSASDSNSIKPGVNGTSYADSGLTAGTEYYYIVEAVDASKAASPESPAASATTQGASSSTPSWSSLYTRAIAGMDVAGGSSLGTQPQAFVEFNLTAPVPFQHDPSKDENREAGRKCVQALDSLSRSLKPATGADPKEPTDEQKQTIKDACGDPEAAPAGLKYATVLKGKNVKDVDWDSLYAAKTAQDFESYAEAVRRNYALDYSPIASRTWFWLNPRISSAPSQVSNLLTTVATPSPSFNSLLGGQYNQIVQDFSVVGGLEIAPVSPRRWARLGSDTLLGLSFIAAAGLQTPLSATANNASIFSIPIPASPALINQLEQNSVPVSNLCGTAGYPLSPPGCTNAVAFVPVERNRFFYQDYVGIRLKSYYFKTASSKTQFAGMCDNRESGEVCPVFPGTFDISIGQNSAYTGGAMHGWMLRTEAFYPLPWYPAIRLFFTAWINVTQGNKNMTPLLLDAAGSSVTATTPGVEVVTLPPFNRDYYRIGVGVDLVQLIKSLTKSSSTGSSSAKK